MLEAVTVILTGSTGSLGSYLLDSLLKQRHVKKVYCLNRADDGTAKQTEVSGSRGLDVAWEAQRVEFLKVDLSQVWFGLDREKYLELLLKVTHIIHNQWPVNFNWDLVSFEPSIRGVRHLLNFCIDSLCGAHLFFISTIGTVSYASTNGLVAEKPNHALSPRLNGYSASKLICELIIEEHVRTSIHKKASICRVGQIGGPVLSNTGMWNKHEWFPTIIASSKHLNKLPAGLGSMDQVNWVPVDILASVILELSGIARPTPSVMDGSLDDFAGIDENVPLVKKSNKMQGGFSSVPIYHAVNPHTISWADLVSRVADSLNIHSNSIVSWDSWVDALRRSESGVDLEANPGLKLLDFFEAIKSSEKSSSSRPMPPLATEVTEACSETLAHLRPVGDEWMMMWMRQWGF